MEEEDYLSKLTEFQYETLSKMKNFENFGGIKNGNTIVRSRMGVLNLPEGCCRKNIISLLLNQETSLPEKKISYVETMEKAFHQSSIMKTNIKKFEVTTANILVCVPNQFHRWKDYFLYFNIHCLFYLKRSNTLATYDTQHLVLTTPTLFPHLVQHHFSQKTVKRIIFYEPQSFRIRPKSFPFHYEHGWIVTSDINWLLFSTNHFIFKYIPESMEYLLFRQLCIFQEKNLLEKLWKRFALKPYLHIEHQCQQEMYEILKGTLSDELYNLLTEGNIQQVLEKLNISCTKESILKQLDAQIQDQIDETEFKILRYKHNQQRKKLLEEERFRLIEKSKHLKQKFQTFQQNTKCILCHDFIRDKTVLIYCCQNICCGNCIYRWLHRKNSCPFCRHVIQNDDLIPISSDSNDCQNKTVPIENSLNRISKLISKQNKIIALLDRYNETHIVVYTKSKSIVNMISSHCEGTLIFQGSTREKKKIYEQMCKATASLAIFTDEIEMNGFSFPFVDHFISVSPLSNEQFHGFLQKFYRLGRTNVFHIHTFMH